jgi:hypothetical protein
MKASLKEQITEMLGLAADADDDTILRTVDENSRQARKTPSLRRSVAARSLRRTEATGSTPSRLTIEAPRPFWRH